MWRYLVMATLLAGIASQVPAVLQASIEQGGAEAAGGSGPLVASLETEPRHANPLAGRVARIERDRRGHFIASAKLNGRTMDVLVDTGATLVAINETTARRLGIPLKEADFRYRVRTANGVAEAAAATIDEIEIGRVIVRDVPATVSRDGALSGVLLGMSFLNKLKKFEVESGTLVLSQ